MVIFFGPGGTHAPSVLPNSAGSQRREGEKCTSIDIVCSRKRLLCVYGSVTKMSLFPLRFLSSLFLSPLCAPLGGVRTLARNSKTRLHVYLTAIHEPSIDLKSVLCHAGLAVGRGEVAKHAELVPRLSRAPPCLLKNQTHHQPRSNSPTWVESIAKVTAVHV